MTVLTEDRGVKRSHPVFGYRNASDFTYDRTVDHRFDRVKFGYLDPVNANREHRAMIARLVATFALESRISTLLLEKTIESSIRMTHRFRKAHGIVFSEPLVLPRSFGHRQQRLDLFDDGKRRALLLVEAALRVNRLVIAEPYRPELLIQKLSLSGARVQTDFGRFQHGSYLITPREF